MLGVRLEPRVAEGDYVRWQPSAAVSNGPSPGLADLTDWTVQHSAVALGPASNFAEVASRTVSANLGKKGGDQNRFDILLVLQGDHHSARIDSGLLTLYVVVEMKVWRPLRRESVGALLAVGQ